MLLHSSSFARERSVHTFQSRIGTSTCILMLCVNLTENIFPNRVQVDCNRTCHNTTMRQRESSHQPKVTNYAERWSEVFSLFSILKLSEAASSFGVSWNSFTKGPNQRERISRFGSRHEEQQTEKNFRRRSREKKWLY